MSTTPHQWKKAGNFQPFYDPTQQPPTPLIDVSSVFPEFSKRNITILAKLPLHGNIKFWPVWNMLTRAQEQKKLDGIHTICCASSGNTVAALATLAKFFGIEHVVAVVSEDIAPGKLQILHILGATVTYAKKGGANAFARELGEQPGWWDIDQYTNRHNWEAFEKWLAPEVWQQTDGQLTVFCATLGTTGTLLGSKNFFQTVTQPPQLVGAICDSNGNVPGARNVKKLMAIGFDCSKAPFPIEHDISAPHAFSMSALLNRHGIPVGPTSGLACYALLRFLKKAERTNELDTYRNKGGDIVAVFICPDSHLPYLDKYTTHLPDYEPVEDLLNF